MNHKSSHPDISLYIESHANHKNKHKLPTRETAPSKFIEIAEDIGKLVGTWNLVEIYGAENQAQEKDRFLDNFCRGQEYNPVFKYSRAAELFDETNINKVRAKLQQTLSDVALFGPQKKTDSYAKYALMYVLRDKIATCNIIEGIATRNDILTAQNMRIKYPGTNLTLIESAVNIFNTICTNQDSCIEKTPLLSKKEQKWLKNYQVSTDKELADAFKFGLLAYGIHSSQTQSGYNISIDPHATSIDVRDNSKNGKYLVIPRNRTLDNSSPVTGDILLKLIGHEIEGHARQSLIGDELFLVGGGKLKIDDETRYEGLAMRYEQRMDELLFGLSRPPTLPFYTFAVASAEAGASFYTIFTDQYFLQMRHELKIPPGTSLPNTISPDTRKKAEDRAWLTTYRIMRGHTDTTNKVRYAMAKDLAYLRGALFDQELQQLQLGYLNELGVEAPGSLSLLAGFDVSEDTIPENLRFKNVAYQYWEEVLKPQYEQSK